MSSMVWVGPDSDEEIQSLFDSIFQVTMETSGGSLLIAGEEEIEQVMDHMLKDHCVAH